MERQEHARLLELADRVEAAAGPNRALDNAIANTIRLPLLNGDPAYTASLDAAMTLARHKGDGMILLRSLLAALGNDSVELRDLPRLACVILLRALANQDDSK